MSILQGNDSDTYTVSVLLFGRNLSDHEDDDIPCHVAIAVHTNGTDPRICRLHHARCPDQVRFIYEYRPEQPYSTDPALRGRCELCSGLSEADADHVNELLARYGAEQSHLPFFGEGNCQNWMAGAISMLEQECYAQTNDGKYWTEAIGKGRKSMEEGWKALGRCWVDNPKSLEAIPKDVDARWHDKEQRVIGKLEDNSTFSSRAEVLQALLQKGPATES